MGEGRVDIVLRLRDSLSSGLATAQQAVQGFGARTLDAMRGAGRGIQYVADQINGLGMVAAMVGGGAIGRSLMEFDSKLRSISNTAQISDQRMEQLKQQILAMSGLRTGKLGSELIEGLDELIEGGMDLETAVAMLDDIGRASTATNTDVRELARMFYFLNSTAKVSAEDMPEAMAAVSGIANKGAFSLKLMADYMPEAIAGMRSLGLTGKQAAIEAATALQMGYKITGQGATGATSARAFMNALVKDSKDLKQVLGVDIFAGQNADGTRRFKDFAAIVQEIAKASGGDVVKLQQVFRDQEALKWIAAVTQDMDAFNGFLEMGAESSNLLGTNFNRNMESATEQIRAARAELEKFITTGTGGLLGDFAKLLRTLNEHPRAIHAITTALAGLAAVATVNKVATFGAGLFSAIRGGRPAGGGASALATAAGLSAVPVMVTNWPPGMGGAGSPSPGPSGVPGAPAGPARRTGLRRLTGAGPTVTQAGPMLNLMGSWAAWQVGTSVGDKLNTYMHKKGAGAVIQRDMAQVMALLGSDDAERLLGEKWQKKGTVGKMATIAGNMLTLGYQLVRPQAWGGVSEDEIAESQGALQAAKATMIPLSMTLRILDDRAVVEDVAGVDDYELQYARA